VGGNNCFSFLNEMRDKLTGLFSIIYFSRGCTYACSLMDATHVLVLKKNYFGHAEASQCEPLIHGEYLKKV
jgi:hypothetical protein